ncbi:hypothetical protein [Sphingopyxis sp. R3-92]|uniref:hypothetical protein n=1 Tax=Sphingopyxis sp. R3-92 TaxID=3158553 RepID=UPI003EE5A895
MPKPQSPVENPPNDVECIALVKPGSTLARHWNFAKPTFGIYEYNKAFDKHSLRFGDGSWQDLMVAMFPDVILLQDDGTDLVERLFD